MIWLILLYLAVAAALFGILSATLPDELKRETMIGILMCFFWPVTFIAILANILTHKLMEK